MGFPMACEFFGFLFLLDNMSVDQMDDNGNVVVVFFHKTRAKLTNIFMTL